MLKVTILKGTIKNNDVVAEKDIPWIREAIHRGEVVIVRGCHDEEKLLAVRHRIHQFGLDHPEGNPERSDSARLYHN